MFYSSHCILNLFSFFFFFLSFIFFTQQVCLPVEPLHYYPSIIISENKYLSLSLLYSPQRKETSFFQRYHTKQLSSELLLASRYPFFILYFKYPFSLLFFYTCTFIACNYTTLLYCVLNNAVLNSLLVSILLTLLRSCTLPYL